MQEKLQLVFEEVAGLNEEKRDLAELYKATLEGTPEYEELGEQIQALREKRKVIENKVMLKLTGQITKLKEVKDKIVMDKEIMSSFVIASLNDGTLLDDIVVKDKFENKYTPVVSVKFKKKRDDNS